VRRSVLGFEPQLAAAGAHVEVRIPCERCEVRADPSALMRIVGNLVSNSVRHGQGMTSFSASLEPGGAEYLVRFANDGAPLPEDAEQLFQRGVTGPAGGAGLGLSIARELAERMGGSVVAENKTADGVTFTLAMPRAEFSES
jgi:signal transduction histidine kinase